MAAAVAAAPDAESGYPASVQILGRHPSRENADICGRYNYRGVHQGRAVYQKPGATAAIRYCPPMHRWVIDREGMRDSDVCVAYADDTVGSEHPAHVRLLWHVWDSSARTHMADAELAVLDAPSDVAVVGRGDGREHCAVNGEYELMGLCHGRPCYHHKSGGIVIRYHAPEDRWLMAANGAQGNICSAFAEASGGAPHPALPQLDWHFWEAARGVFLPDPRTRALAAPSRLHIIGRAAEAENARICGTYRLAGVHDGRPVYVQPGTHTVIRYSAKRDWWLIDCEGLTEPSLVSKLYQWMLSGDASAAGERCSAYAEARGALYPGFRALEWQVWSSSGGRHVFDPWVRATTAPLVLRLRGRDAARENGDIAGDYVLAGTHLGYPAYQQSGSQMAIRYWPPMRRWVVDRCGLRNSDSCVAYADSAGDAEHPNTADCLWHVFETSRGIHLADPGLTLAVPADAPEDLGLVAGPRVPTATAPGVHPPPFADSVQGAGPKRRRLDYQDFGAAAAAAANAQAGGSRWLGLFGGA